MLRSMTIHVAQQAIEIIYPSSCIACHGATGEGNAMCASCWRRMRFIEKPWCERLGTPFAQDLGAGLISPEAFARPPVFARARAAARFEDGPARELVHRLKYGDRPELAAPMARWMARAGAELLQDADLLVPVPLHFGRLFRRRFNQAALLADAISQMSGVPADPFVLRRIKPTRQQVGLTRAQRAENLQGAFRVPDEARGAISGKHLVLVDDVLTTGSTMNATARVLLRAGAARVDALVFARVVHDGS